MAKNLLSPFDQSKLDDESAALVLSLHREDLQSIVSAAKGKGREDEITDSTCALKAFEEELAAMETALSDRSMSRSLTRAVITDFAVLTETAAQEAAIAYDRAIAERMSGGENRAIAPVENKIDSSLDDLVLARLTTLYVSGSDDKESFETSEDDPAFVESSAWATSRISKSRSMHECVACGDQKRDFEVFKAPCGHHYCQQCIGNLFELCMVDETLYPPRCCRQEISLKSARLYLEYETVERFKEKSVELSTANRTYCSRPSCSLFIPPANITKATSTAICIACSTSTCTVCKGTAHVGECPEDTSTQLVLAAAQEQGWQRCDNCGAVVELDLGCNHITCRCRSEFCYVCGARWKTCNCPQWAEERLLARARQVVARGPRRLHAPEAERVQQAVANLRQRHNCTHDRWQFIGGSHRCEECHNRLPHYIFQCEQCHIQACNRCRRNRL